jgi:hypothetical protein
MTQVLVVTAVGSGFGVLCAFLAVMTVAEAVLYKNTRKIAERKRNEPEAD